MIRDPIVEEVRESRRKTEEACGHDWKRLAQHYRGIRTGNGRVIRLEPKLLPRTAGKFEDGLAPSG